MTSDPGVSLIRQGSLRSFRATALQSPRGCDEESNRLRRTKYLHLSIYITYLNMAN